MRTCVKNVFERHTLLNKLSARKKFYTATMSSNASAFRLSNRIRQLSATRKSINVMISESKMDMGLLSGFAEQYNALFSALVATDEDESKLKFEFIKSPVIQGEPRIVMRTKSAQEKFEAAALLTTRPSNRSRNGGYQARSSHYCKFCKRAGHIESRCWANFARPNASRNNWPSSKPPFIANQSNADPVVCLVAKYENSSESKNSNKWFEDSGCLNHMTFHKSMFSSYTAANIYSVELRNNNAVKVLGTGTVEIPISVHGKRVKYMLRNVLHVPELRYQLLSVPTIDKSG